MRLGHFNRESKDFLSFPKKIKNKKAKLSGECKYGWYVLFVTRGRREAQ